MEDETKPKLEINAGHLEILARLARFKSPLSWDNLALCDTACLSELQTIGFVLRDGRKYQLAPRGIHYVDCLKKTPCWEEY